METSSGEGVMKEEKFPHNRKPSHRRFSRELWNLRGKHSQKEKKKKTEYAPNHNDLQKSGSDPCIHQQRGGWAERYH